MNKRFRIIVGLTAVGVPLLPLLLYVWQFGWRLSPEHGRWGEFGSAMSGIYTPVLAIATLAVLIMQVRLQAQMHRHERDQAFVVQARADIEFYAQRLLAAVAAKVPSGESVRGVLHAEFQPPSVNELDSERLRALADELDSDFPEVLALAYAILAVLAGLSANDESPFRVNYYSAIQKLIAVLSFETCVSIEHYHRARGESPDEKSKYHFSPLLKRRHEA